MATAVSLGHRLCAIGAALGLLIFFTSSHASMAHAATTIDGPIDLGTAASYGVLGASAVTNTGPTVINGDLGVSPGTSLTGFDGAPDGVVNGTVHQTDAAATQAQADTTTAYDVAASLTPTQSGLTELAGLSLSPGVYSGGALVLSDNGALTLAGSAESIWVFQAASTLTIGSASQITITGGASGCNVFWQVGSSATLGTAAQFQGSVLALESITATTGATVVGRLLARTAAVTLDTNTITATTGCPPPGTVTETTPPVITSGNPTPATAETPYSFTVTASGTPEPTFTVTAGALPQGLTLDLETGVISGTPLAAGTSTFTITADNGEAPAASTTYELTVAPAASDSPTPTVSPSGSPTPAETAIPTPTATSTATDQTTAVAAAADSSTGTGTPLAATGVTTGSALAVGILALILGVALTAVSTKHRRQRSRH